MLIHQRKRRAYFKQQQKEQNFAIKENFYTKKGAVGGRQGMCKL